MSEVTSKARKAIVTLEMVREVFTAYGLIRARIGMPVVGHTFDKGPRGKGFAQYDATDTIVRTFEGKEEAHTFYVRYVEVAEEVLSAPAVSVVQEATEEVQEAQEATPEAVTVPQPRKPRSAAKAAS